MERVARFEKVSFEQFKKDFEALFGDKYDVEKAYDTITLPKRSTAGSAGYDFVSPIEFTLKPRETIRFPLGIRCKMNDSYFLGIFPRSSLGFNYRLQIDNTIGVVDSDFYYAYNEGDIGMKMTNDSTEGKEVHIRGGERIAQGIFIPYGITWDDNEKSSRSGGIGSTGRV